MQLLLPSLETIFGFFSYYFSLRKTHTQCAYTTAENNSGFLISVSSVV